MEFGCSVCEYTSSQKHHIIRHINRKKSCGVGAKEIIEIPVDISCKYCNKKFATKENLKEHSKNNCKHKDDALKEENRKLKEELRKAKTTNTTNNTNYNTNYIFILNNYEDTKLDKISDKVYNKIINDSEEPYKIIPSLIRHIHFNNKIPENHNIYISNRNKNNKHLQVYKNGQWEITDKSTEIDNIINDKETNLSDWIDEKGEKYPEALEKYNEYIEQKYDEDTAKLIKEEVELLLYNNRHMIKVKN